MRVPKVSVLMATYNMSEFLPVAIESVLEQTFTDFELLIGDNRSTDDTAEIARKYASQDPRVTYHRNAVHMTAAENFNQCLERSTPESEYWIMLASDDWWKPELLAKLVETLDRNQDLTFAHCDATITDGTGAPIGVTYSELWGNMNPPSHGPHAAAAELFNGCYVMALGTLVNRSVKDRIYPVQPLMDPTLVLAPDHNLWLQLMVRGARAYFVDETLMFYRKHRGAMTMPWNDAARIREEVMIFGEKLAGVCPPDLEPIRLEALRSRLAMLGFHYLEHENPSEARQYLGQASQMQGRRRIDILFARAVAALPFSSSFRADIWSRAVRLNSSLGRTA